MSTDSGWNWTPSIGQLAMPDGHDLAVAGGRRDLELLGNSCGRERVVAAGFELVREAGEQAAAVMPDGASLAVHELPRGLDLAAEGFDDRLVAEADAERRAWPRARQRTTSGVDPRRRTAGPGGDDEVGRAEPCRRVRVDRVVAAHDHLRAELAEQVREVVRERVVVVDEQDQRCSASARSIAASTAASLRRHSSCSAAGSESATMPAPACRCATPSLQHDRADRDARVERRVVRQRVADRAGVRAAAASLELGDELHRAHLRRAGHRAGGEAGAQQVERARCRRAARRSPARRGASRASSARPRGSA